MALALARSTASNCTNPVLQQLTSANGFLQNPILLEFQIFDISTPAKRATPEQVFPGSGRETVDLTTCATGGAQIGKGRFVAVYSVDGTESLGDHLIKWFTVLETGDAEVVHQQEFLVVHESEYVDPSSYCTITEMRDEGLEACEVTDKRLRRAIKLASLQIDRITGRTFRPQFALRKVNGRGGPILQFSDAIIAIEEVRIKGFAFEPSPSELLSNDSLRVYNRHLTQGTLDPDDRQNPKIEIVRGVGYFGRSNSAYTADYVNSSTLIFPAGQQNVHVDGVFGYTEPDGSTTGSTPEEIKLVCALLTLRAATQLTDPDRASDNQAFRITMERTRQQTISFADPSGRAASMTYGYFTGDPEIDAILASFMRPPELGAA